MSTSVAEIKAWFEEAERAGATHMIIVVDTLDLDDYPVLVFDIDDIDEMVAKYNDKNMQRIMEVYRISLGWDAQSGPERVLNY